MKTIADIIETFEHRNKIALIFKTGYRTFRFTFNELHKKILQTVQFLENEHIQKGDKIIIWAYNSPNWTIVFLACAYKGVIIVPIDAKATPEFVEKIHSAVQAKAVFHALYKLPPKQVAKSFILDYLDKYIELFPAKPIKTKVTEDDLLEIVYTSGTTADPKGVMLTHKNLVANITSVIKVVNTTSKNTFLSVLPLTHLFEQNPGFLAPLSLGCTIIYMQSIRSNLIFKTLAEERVTNIILVPRLLKLFADGIQREYEKKGLLTLFHSLLNIEAPSAIKKFLFFPVHKKFGIPHFEYFVSGGAPLDTELESFWNKMGFTILQGYGLTECSPILTVNPFGKKRRGSVGVAIPGVSLTITNDHEVYARGNNVTQGYYQKEQATKDLFDKEWMRTGDIGTLDEDGYLFLKGRVKDMIVTSAGVNVYPEDIERQLLKNSAVKDACVLGLPTENGEEVHAEILLKSPTDLHQLIADTNEALNESQMITSYARWEHDDFPRTTTMKIQKRFVLSEIQKRKQNMQEKPNANTPKLYTLIARITSIDPKLVKPKAKLATDLKLTSINRVELVSLIEQEFTIDINEEEITPNTTVADLEQMIKERKQFVETTIFHRWLLWPVMRVIRYIYNVVFLDNVIRLFCIRTISGREHIRHLKQPVIFIANHTSYMDAPNILMSLPYEIKTNIAVAAYREYFDIPKHDYLKRLQYAFYFYHASLFTNIYLLPKVKGFKKSLEYTGELLDKNWNILFFPEGKHSPDGTLQPFLPGIGWLAKEMQVPIVPIKVEGMEKVLPGDIGDKLTIPKRGKVRVTFGEPVTLDYTKSVPELTQELQSIVARL